MKKCGDSSQWISSEREKASDHVAPSLRGAGRASRALGHAWFHEVPEIPVEILEHGDRSMRRDCWLANELDAGFDLT